MSWIGAALARPVIDVPLSDPMTGFFAVSRQRFESVADEINPRGFKVLLEFVAHGPKPTVAEVGYRFGARHSGTTKLSGPVVAQFLQALAVLGFRRIGKSRPSSQ